MGNIKNGKFVYKNEDGMKKMHEFYDKTLASLDVPYSEDYFDTSFGKTHCLLVGDPEKPRICTIHGGNGITTLNLKLFLPLLQEYCIIAPDVIRYDSFICQDVSGECKKCIASGSVRNCTWLDPAYAGQDGRSVYEILF